MAQPDDPQQWLNAHGDYLYRYAMSRMHDSEIAQDLIQETLLAAWRGYDNFAGQSTIRTWLVGILKHKIIDHIRKEIRGRDLNDVAGSDPTSAYFNQDGSWSESPHAWRDNPEALLNNEQFQQTLQSCVKKLPAKQRVVFQMRDIVGEESEAVCKQCEITTTNLHVLLHRARMALRKCLETHWFGGERSS